MEMDAEDNRDQRVLMNFIAGVIAGFIAALVVFDVFQVYFW